MVISKKPRLFIYAALVALLPLFGLANPNDSTTVSHQVAHADKTTHENTEGLTKEQLKVKETKEFIRHHLLDSHDFHLFSYGKDEAGHENHVSFPLPVILWDNGIHFFMSSKFEHGHAAAESKGNYYAINHHNGQIYKTDAAGTFIENDKGKIANDKPIDLSITKNVSMILITGLIMFLLFAGLGKSYKKNGSIAAGAGRFFEPIILYIRDEIAIPNIGVKYYRKYMSFLLTIFFFVWFLNMFGLTPLGVNVTGNIAITAALAIIAYIITTFTAKKDYWKHIFWMPGVPVPMKFILAPIELLGTFIKPFSLMIRLYANMLAGHVVLMSLIALMYSANHFIGSPLALLLSFVLTILEVLVALLQAYIFTMLAALYFGSAVEEHHHEEAH
ncbi:MAG TPA: F0F1 ATP synthase subunit A [Flavobacterium sp.]|jgi:F-type H+-transporting ATPase subunit a|uniref:F0F1 ATP synthase subunit A n=1 Tax=Flavobacterium sp. TaxID=239 RepID=UPI002BD2DE21|nr:F0F1 ATP synthase subunit A [Bacteroidota bacterium]HPW97466.1 F0F1 ATP synthase subunit A [Flavobacterium sp.]